MDVREAHDRALDLLGAKIRGVPAGRWQDPTPCAEWDVRTLVNHNVAENLWAKELLEGRTIEEVGDRFEGDLLGDDPREAYERSAEAVRSVTTDDRVLGEQVHVSYGPVPGEAYLEQRWIDLLVHAWDLTVATEQSTDDLPADLASVALEAVRAQEDAIRASGVFGAPVEVGDAASDLARLVAFLGRDPTAW